MFKEVINYYKLVFGFVKEVGEKVVEGCVIGNFGCVFEGLGELDKVISYFKVFFSIVKEVGDKDMEGYVY